MKRVGRHLVPNLGTLLILGLFLSLQATGVMGATRAVHTADVPTTIGYQGQLTDSAGSPVPDDTYVMHFRVYDDATDGTALWNEDQSVAVTSGVFDVLLGSVNPLSGDLFDSSQRWLGVQVEADPEMVPRQPLASVPFALRGDVADASITTDKLADGSVTSAKMDAVDAYSYVEVQQSTTSTNWTSLPTPDSVTFTLDRTQWVNIHYQSTCGATNGYPAYVGLSINGGAVPNDTLIEMWNGVSWTISGIHRVQLPAGQHTIAMKYKTGSGATAYYWRRKLLVFSVSQ